MVSNTKTAMMKTYVILTLGILTQATGNVFLSREMKNIASALHIVDGNFLVLLFQALENPTIWLGTALLIISFLLFITALSLTDLSFVLPVVSIEVVVNVAFAGYFLNEPVSLLRWIGTGLIFLGVTLVVKSGKQTARRCEEREIPECEDR
jgi:multidrug transporter EmrE-like cation transporter